MYQHNTWPWTVEDFADRSPRKRRIAVAVVLLNCLSGVSRRYDRQEQDLDYAYTTCARIFFISGIQAVDFPLIGRLEPICHCGCAAQISLKPLATIGRQFGPLVSCNTCSIQVVDTDCIDSLGAGLGAIACLLST